MTKKDRLIILTIILTITRMIDSDVGHVTLTHSLWVHCEQCLSRPKNKNRSILSPPPSPSPLPYLPPPLPPPLPPHIDMNILDRL